MQIADAGTQQVYLFVASQQSGGRIKAEHLVDQIIRTTIDAQEESGWPIRAFAVRTSTLVTAIMSMLDDNVTAEQINEFHFKVYGVARTTEGDAS